MGQRAIDMSGQKIGALTVLRRTGYRGGPAKFHCLCVCGNMRVVNGGDLRRHFVISCGCLIKGRPKGLSKHPLYSLHGNMLDRCYNPAAKDYPQYGGRGIKVCLAWHDLECFATDMGERPSPRHSVDRIDNNGDWQHATSMR